MLKSSRSYFVEILFEKKCVKLQKLNKKWLNIVKNIMDFYHELLSREQWDALSSIWYEMHLIGQFYWVLLDPYQKKSKQCGQSGMVYALLTPYSCLCCYKCVLQ